MTGARRPGNWDDAVSLGAQSGAFIQQPIRPRQQHDLLLPGLCARTRAGTAWAPSSASFTTLAYSRNRPSPTAPRTRDHRHRGAGRRDGASPPAGTRRTSRSTGAITTAAPTAGIWDDSLALGPQSAGLLDPCSLGSARSRPTTSGPSRRMPLARPGQARTESFTTLDVSHLVINEFMAANDGGISEQPERLVADRQPGSGDEQRLDRDPQHRRRAPLTSAAGTSPTMPRDLSKWTFPPTTTLGSGRLSGRLCVRRRIPLMPNGNLHTNFSLRRQRRVPGPGPAGLAALPSAFGPGGTDFRSQDDDVSYGLHPGNCRCRSTSHSPTPGAPNGAGGHRPGGDTTFSPDRGLLSVCDRGHDHQCDGWRHDLLHHRRGDRRSTPLGTRLPARVRLPRLRLRSRAPPPVRAAATMAGLAPTNIDTHTYVLLDIDNADTDGSRCRGSEHAIPATNAAARLGKPLLRRFQHGHHGVEIDRNHRPTTASSTAQAMLHGLRDIPTISIAMDQDDFSGSNGIYTNSTEHGTGLGARVLRRVHPGHRRYPQRLAEELRPPGAGWREPQSRHAVRSTR